MINKKKKWIDSVNWQRVSEINQAICQKESVEHKPGQGFESARQLWESTQGKQITLKEALDLCRRTAELKPFKFLNNNTFASATQLIIDDVLKQAPPLVRQIVKTTIAHYVVGQVNKRELDEVLKFLENFSGNGELNPNEFDKK